MALSNDRVEARTPTPHVHEQQAVDFAIQALPDRDPFRLWALVDLVDPSGRRWDLDLVVIGYHAVYLIEIKSHPGRFSGDVVDWAVDFHDGGRTRFENPLRLTGLKARVLGSLLDRQLGKDRRPWVQELVFVSDERADISGLRGAAANGVVTRKTFERAITFGEFEGAPSSMLRRRIDRKLGQQTAAALREIGLRESIAQRKVNDLVLESVLLDRQAYQDHLARNERLPGLQARVRTYQVPLGVTQERRQQLVRAAEREAQTLAVLSDHPSILKLKSYVADGPTGAPCVVFEHFEDGQPLDAFLRENPDLSLEDRFAILQPLAEALAYCHRKGVLHRGLAPSAVLVRRATDSGKIQIRLLNFQLATSAELISGTSHLTGWMTAHEIVYLAPEVLVNASNASPASDVFSLGAIAYLVLTGKPPGDNLIERATLLAPGYLSLATARDDMAAGLDGTSSEESAQSDLEEVMKQATAVKSIDRDNEPLAWIELLLEQLTAPSKPEPREFVDPLVARKDDEIAPAMRVEQVLGTGSTARTLRVETKEGLFALKVGLSAEQDERVAREADTLRKLKADKAKDYCDRIVRLFDKIEVGGRVCLLLTDAGDTLAHRLAEKGPEGLDYARRWGEDLLSALEHLELHDVQHRDIKPGNLGVLTSDQKKRRQLLLFDFSLSSGDAKEIRAGTPAYRDPFLALRGSWDAAADRYAAAVTLHELLTGVRPRWGTDDIATATDDPISIAAERFDASARDRLVAFFRQALQRDSAARFESAEQMRTEWLACFARQPVREPTVEQTGQAPAAVALPAGLSLRTSIEALPLSPEAKNALNRVGFLDVRGLLSVPNNDLSAMRGVGRETAREIIALSRRPELSALRAQIDASEVAADAFMPGYVGSPTALSFVTGVSQRAIRLLQQAGLPDLAAVARTSRTRLSRIVVEEPGALDALNAALTAASAESHDAPCLSRWLDAFLPKPQKRGDKPLVYVRALFGLDEVRGTRSHTVASVAAAEGVSRPLIHQAVAKLREQWLAAPELAELQRRLDAVLETLGGVARVETAGAALARELCGEALAEPDVKTAEHAGAALVQVAVRTRDDLKLARLGGTQWVLPEALDVQELSALGELADELALAEPLLSPGAVVERLRALVAPDAASGASLLGALPDHRLVAIAALASKRAAKSARLELYPRGMAHERALDLCVAALPAARLSPELLRQFVLARYPEADALPSGEALPALMEAHGYRFDPHTSTFARKQARQNPSTEAAIPRARTTHTGHRTQPDPEAHLFAQQIAAREKRGSFCVLEVAPSRARQTAEELSRRLSVPSTSLERELLRALSDKMAELGVDRELVLATDRAGRSSPEWPTLRELVQQAAAQMFESLAASSQPLVLTEPGLLARYQLDAFVQRLIEHTRDDNAPAVFLVVPAASDGGAARISHPDGDLPVPLISQAQHLRVPDSWLGNLDRASAS